MKRFRLAERENYGLIRSLDISRQAITKIDVFSEEDYRAFLAAADISRTSPDYTPPPWEPGNPPNPVAKGNTPIVREWGEDTYIIVWDILDPNDGSMTDPRQRWTAVCRARSRSNPT